MIIENNVCGESFLQKIMKCMFEKFQKNDRGYFQEKTSYV